MKKKKKAVKRICVIINEKKIPAKKSAQAGFECGNFSASEIFFLSFSRGIKAADKTAREILAGGAGEVFWFASGRLSQKFKKDVLPDFLSGLRADHLDVDFHFGTLG